MSKLLQHLGNLWGQTKMVDVGSYEALKQALTPPTSDVVHKKLCEHYNTTDVFYDEDTRSWYLLNEKGELDICNYEKDLEDKWYFEGSLTPHLITLIGRFYEVQDV